MSSEDKKTKKYCCYEKSSSGVECEALSEEAYTLAKAFYEEYPDEYEFKCNSSLIKLGVIFFSIFFIF